MKKRLLRVICKIFKHKMEYVTDGMWTDRICSRCEFTRYDNRNG